MLFLNLAKAAITSIIQEAGFKRDYNWLEVDIFDEDGTSSMNLAFPRNRASISWFTVPLAAPLQLSIRRLV